MRNENPGFTPPNDGASVLVVEGLGAGLGGCDYSLDLIAYITIVSINSGQRTVTEISPQSDCSPVVQDWKNVVLQLVTNVMNSAPNAPTLWGGIMLDEEDDFWETYPGSIAAYWELNAAVEALMMTVPGIPWYYTENFTGEDVWSAAEFDLITRGSVPAPQIATQYMVDVTNSRIFLRGDRALVAWSLHPDYQFRNLYGAEFRIIGEPYRQWGLTLSNCFRIAQVCNDWDGDAVLNAGDNCLSVENTNQQNTDSANQGANRPGTDGDGDACDNDDDGDGYPDAEETSIGEAPTVYCKIMRADVDNDRLVSVLDLSAIASWFGQSVPPAPDRYRQDGDSTISVLDLSIVGSVFTLHVSACA